MLRETQWFRNMQKLVKDYVESCKCQAANPTPPQQLKPLPKIPWHTTCVDYKGPIGHGKYYFHTQMDAYTRYPVVHLTKSTKLTELKKAMSNTIRTLGRPEEVWSDGGPPYNSLEWIKCNKDWGIKAKRTMPYHPAANGMVERFNRNLKLVIHAAYADGQDPEEEVAKYVAAYRSTPHSVTGVSPNKLMFNREISTKLPRLPTKSQAKHHRDARRRDQEVKLKTKTYYDKKHRTRHEDIQVGDKAYRRNRQPSTTRGPWEPEPHQVTKVVYNQITGTRDHTNSKRDRGDWKLVKQRPPIPRQRWLPAHHRRGL